MDADLALSLRRRGYLALPRRRDRDRAGGDALSMRLLGRPALVVSGAEGARLFYDGAVTRRTGAVPRVLADLLFGRGAVHGTDDAEHHDRKRLFLDILGDDRVAALGRTATAYLEQRARWWPVRTPFSLFDELVVVYGAAVLDWAGTRCRGDEADEISRDLAAIVDGFGGAGLAYPRAWQARRRIDAWARRVIRRARSADGAAPAGTAVAVMAASDLPLELAAVELVNVVRPTVAVAWLGVFAAWALVEHPEYGERLAAPDGDEERREFADEVRRLSPFVPALAARARGPVSWRGHRLPGGGRIVLDVPLTNRHPDTWEDPDTFRPERWRERVPTAFDFVPQGGGDVRTGHRCPGEGISTTLLSVTLECLARRAFRVETPTVDLERIPTLPSDGLRVTSFSH